MFKCCTKISFRASWQSFAQPANLFLRPKVCGFIAPRDQYEKTDNYIMARSLLANMEKLTSLRHIQKGKLMDTLLTKVPKEKPYMLSSKVLG